MPWEIGVQQNLLRSMGSRIKQDILERASQYSDARNWTSGSYQRHKTIGFDMYIYISTLTHEINDFTEQIKGTNLIQNGDNWNRLNRFTVCEVSKSQGRVQIKH